MRSPNVLQPILARVSDDSKYPSVKSAANFAQMVIGFNKRLLKYVFRHIRASGHPQSMAVQRVAVSGYQNPESILVACQNLGDDLLISINSRRLTIRRRASRTHCLGTLILQRCGCRSE